MLQLMGYSNSEQIISIDPQQFNDLMNSFDGITATKLVNRYKIPEFKANILMPTMIFSLKLLVLLILKP